VSFDLDRFVRAQNSGGTYDDAVRELTAGRKTSHWMWFVFPQIEGLGRSGMAQRYAIASLDEARAYLAHPVLGDRLRKCAEIVAGLNGTAEAIFGGIDAVKLRSSMTLFAAVAGPGSVFETVLERYYGGAADPQTTRILADQVSGS
jgi:uncharacterized protein (DUF1810 family)